MKKLIIIVVLSLSVVLLASCDRGTVEGYGDGGKISAFSVEGDVLANGESFTINMDMVVAFIANIYIREVVGDGGVDNSIFYASSSSGVIPSSLTYTYVSGNLQLNEKTVASVKANTEYKVYAKVCDFTNSCIVSRRSTIYFGSKPDDGSGDNGTVVDNNTADLGYALLGNVYSGVFDKMPFFANTIDKKVAVVNNDTAVTAVSVLPLDNIHFTYKFSNGLDTISLPAGASDNLTIGSNIKSFLVSDIGKSITAPYTISGVTMPLQKVLVKPINVATLSCESYIPELNPCNYLAESGTDKLVFDTTVDNITISAFAIDQAMVDKFKTVVGGALLKFDDNFFTKFEKDSRTTCVISDNGTVNIDKPCFVFINKKTLGITGNLTATGADIAPGVNSIVFKFK